MLPNLNALLAPALMERLVLVVNHVLLREPVAVARLLPHQGRVMRLELLNLPRLLAPNPPPPLAFIVTPAGGVEWCREPVDADLRVRVQAGNPAALAMQMAGGQLPPFEIDGDAQLATDVDWLLKNLRWDVADDLQRLFGPVVAHQLARMGSGLSQGLQAARKRYGSPASVGSPAHRAGPY